MNTLSANFYRSVRRLSAGAETDTVRTMNHLEGEITP